MADAGFNWALVEFDDVVEYVGSMVGDPFMKAVNLANDIVENPQDYTGPQAAIAAVKLGAYRTKLAAAGSYFKIKTPETKKPSDRLTKDAILSMYDALLELINTLKLQARHEKEYVING